MIRITELITISELSRLINLSRPTLYKYLNDYENNKLENISIEFIKLFDFISIEAKNKQDVYNYCINEFDSSDDKAIIDKIKMLIKDENYRDLFNELTKKITNDKIKQIKKILEE